MRITDFLSDELFCLPIIQPPRQDFKQFVFKQLDNFIKKLEQIAPQNSHFEDVDQYPIERILERQCHLTAKLKATLDAYYDGKPAEAFDCLYDGLVSKRKDFNDVLKINWFPAGDNFYRLRCHKENFPLAINDFFHIPFEKKRFGENTTF